MCTLPSYSGCFSLSGGRGSSGSRSKSVGVPGALNRNERARSLREVEAVSTRVGAFSLAAKYGRSNKFSMNFRCSVLVVDVRDVAFLRIR